MHIATESVHRLSSLFFINFTAYLVLDWPNGKEIIGS